MRDLTVGKESSNIIRFAMPMLIGSIFQQLYSFTDSVIVGKFLGNESLTAVGNSMPIIFGLISMIIGVTMGGTIVISQYYGAKDFERLKKAIDTLYVFLFISSIIISITGIIFSRTILHWTGIQPGSEEEAVKFLNIYLMGLVLFFGYNGVSAILRGIGDSTTPLYFMIFSTIMNIGFDLLFIVKFKMGVEGAASATIIAQGCAFIAAIIYLNKTHEFLSFKLKDLSFDYDIFKKSLRISLPSGFQHTFVAVGMAALYGIVNRFEEPVPSAYTAAGRIDLLALIPAMTFSQALSTFVGQNIGANKPDRVKKGLKSTLLISSIVCIVITFAIISTSSELISLFSSKNNELRSSFMDTGKSYLIIVSSFYLVFNTMFMFNGVLRGAGDTLIPMFITLFSLWFIRIPIAHFLSIRIGEKGIWWAIPLAWFIGMTFSFLYYKSGNWKNKGVINTRS